ncbi:MAG: hypothetical protein Q8P00_02380 [Dehalococcoidia bacterium]|nr:hypothetical protein [Dehalococcoidia bacterium]
MMSSVLFLPEEDDRERMFTDMVVRAHYLCDQERLQDHYDDFPARLKEMEGFGVVFERLPDGKLQRHPGRGTGWSVDSSHICYSKIGI